MASGSGGSGFWNRWLGSGSGPLPQVTRTRLGIVGGAAALLTLVAGAAAGSLGWIGLPYTIEVPLATWPGYEYLYLAHRKGLAKPFGLRLRTRDYPYPLAAVQRVQVALGLVREGAPLPRVDDEPLRQAVASMGA